MKFRVNEIIGIKHGTRAGMFSSAGLDIDVDATEDQMQDIFYKIWEHVESDVLKKWVSAEGIFYRRRLSTR